MLGKFIFIILIVFMFVNTDQSEASYITKKSDTTKEIEKIEKAYADGLITKSACTKKKSKALKLGKTSKTICDNVEVKGVKKESKKKKIIEYIKKKVKLKKKAKKEFIKKEKDLSNEAKSWITKKTKKLKEEKYYETIEELPDSNLYFTGVDDDGKIYIGYMNPDLDSELIKEDYNEFNKGNKGKVFLVDGKTVCNVYSEIDDKIIKKGSYEGTVAINCDGGINFRGSWYQTGEKGFGIAQSETALKLDFKFSTSRKIAIASINTKQEQKKEFEKKKVEYIKKKVKEEKIIVDLKELESIDLIPPEIIIAYKNDFISSNEVPFLEIQSNTQNYEINGTVQDLGGSVEKLTLLVENKKIKLDKDNQFSIKGKSNKFEEIILTASDGSQNTFFIVKVNINTQKKQLITTDEKYYALVIGNNKYSNECSGKCWNDLKTAVNDAEAVAEVLEKRYHFDVTKLINATYIQTRKAIFNMRNKLTANENLLIYYAGHGKLDAKEDSGYLIPVDGEKDNNIFWINNDEIIRNLKASEAKHVLVMLDSCFATSLLRGTDEDINITKVNPRSFEESQRLRARLIMTSGGNEPVLDSFGDSKHSLFANKFISILENKDEIYFKDGAISANLLFLVIKEFVQDNSKQTPEFSKIFATGHDGGEFHFVLK